MVPHFLQNPGLFSCSTHFLHIFSYSIPSPNLHDTHIILYTLKPPVIQLSISRHPQGLLKIYLLFYMSSPLSLLPTTHAF